MTIAGETHVAEARSLHMAIGIPATTPIYATAAGAKCQEEHDPEDATRCAFMRAPVATYPGGKPPSATQTERRT